MYCFSWQEKESQKERKKKKMTFLSIEFFSLDKGFVEHVKRTHYFCLYLA